MIRLQSFLINFIKKSTFGGFRHFLFWNVYTFYLIDLGVPKMGFLVFLLGGIWRGVDDHHSKAKLRDDRDHYSRSRRRDDTATKILLSDQSWDLYLHIL